MAFDALTSNVAGDFAIDGHGFLINATEADLSGCEELLAAQGSGTYINVRKITINCVTAITVTIGAGETTGAVTTALVGPINFLTTWGHFEIEFLTPLKLPANTALTADASGAGAVAIVVEGYVD